MKILIVCLVVLVILLIGIIAFQKKKNHFETSKNEKNEIKNYEPGIIDDPTSQLEIPFEMLPSTEQIDDSRLVEIKDERIISQFSNLVPGSVKVLGNLKSVKSYKGLVKGGGQLYQAILPNGAKELAKSRTMKDAYRGITHGGKGIKDHANFVPANSTTNSMASLNVGNATMGVAAMVVGQYYMKQINSELTGISDDISQVIDFQDNEYRSKVFALVTQVQKITQFQVDVLENEELRIRELSDLNNWEQECIQLLGQANLTIVNFSEKENLKFNQYEKELMESNKWFVYQKTLLNVLYKIADLKHTLNLGSVSRKKCNALLPTYSRQVKVAQKQLNEWHQSQTKKLGIDIDENRMKRFKFEKIVYKIPGLINEKYNFKSISEETVNLITDQTTDKEISRTIEKDDLFQKDVKMIVKEGKLYYLPEVA